MRATRRRFLGTCAGSFAALAARPTWGGGAGDSSLALTRLTEDVALVTGAGSNVVVLAQPGGLALINGGHADRAADLHALLAREFPGRAVRLLFNTDWHPEHTGSNAIVAQAGGRIVAHEHTKQWLSIPVVGRWQQRTFAPLAPHARPTETFYTTGALTFGSETLAYAHLGQAHTDGDIYVHLRSADVIVAGDVVSVGEFPTLDYSSGGWIGGMVTALRTLLGVATAQTRIVPGAGPVQGKAHLQAEHDMLAAMRDRLVKLLKSGQSVEDMLAAAPAREFEATWGDPERFIRNAYQGLWYHARELGGVI